jgi:eukaryotic translation initiation factor 2C
VPIIVILTDGPLPFWRNFEIIHKLQTQVEPELFARPGVYDGRKNLYTAFELPFESGSSEASPSGCKIGVALSSLSVFQFVVPMDSSLLPGQGTQGGHHLIEYRVRLTQVASIETEYDLYPSFPGSTNIHSTSSVLQGFLQGVRGRDGTGSAAITVRTVQYNSCSCLTLDRHSMWFSI